MGAPAPAAEGTGVAGLLEASRAPDPSAKPRAGNPLWTVPLNTLSATRDRPLFSASRRPPVVALPIVAPPQKHEVLAPPPPERPSLRLIGTIVGRKASLAMLQGSDADDFDNGRRVHAEVVFRLKDQGDAAPGGKDQGGKDQGKEQGGNDQNAKDQDAEPYELLYWRDDFDGPMQSA